MFSTIAAYVYTFLTLIVVLFQFALAAGAPWGHLAMGGRFPGVFPLHMRVAAVIQALILSGLALIVLSNAGIILADFYDLSNTLIWVVVVINIVSLVMNTITPSKQERAIWMPVTLILAICSSIVALN